MAHNKLRREIANYVQRDKAQSTSVSAEVLLARALNALGGPVADSRPAPSAPSALELTEAAVQAGERTDHPVAAPIVGADPGDESEHVSGLGEINQG